MLTYTRNTLQKAWRQALNYIAALHYTNTDIQTELTWAKAIGSYAAVPTFYKPFFEPLLTDGRKFPYTVLTPSYEGFIHRTTQKLVCDFGNEIVILERGGNTFTVQRYPYEGISYIEVGTILLHSWIKISSVGSHGGLISSQFEFNTVTDYLFFPILERIRSVATGSTGPALSSEVNKFNHMARSHYKFMNYARRSLLAGEKVLHAVMQPEIRKRVLRLLGKTFYRTISCAQMCILTDKELILIHEDASRSVRVKYGGIWDYIPLNKIVSMSQSGKGNDLLVLSILLPANTRLECVFQASAKPEVDRLLDLFNRL